MSTPRRHRTAQVASPTVDKPLGRPRRNYARWRALTLSLVYVVFALHILHWKLTGKTLAPLELNEVMYTLELGIITAGFLFMSLLVLGTLLFGRFFCSWACHIMVLQDLCAWLLRKIGIRPKRIRSRVLLFVPLLTALYMFIWPQIMRVWHERAFPTFHLATDADGWASLVTNNFWRNLPSAPIIVLTFLVCGFLIVYVMGSRSFCTYVCPYGAIFSLADRFSPGRIVVNDKCQQCGTCTAACTSGVRVHEEVKSYGMIVNPACLKDFDCISSCPQQALSYHWSRPALFKSYKSGGRFGLPYDFTWGEDLLMGSVFIVVLLTFRGLYSRVPFLLALSLGAILGYVAVVTGRLFTRLNVTFSVLSLRQLGRLTPSGLVFGAGASVLAIFVAHSAFVRYHEYRGLAGARLLVDNGADTSSAPVLVRAHERLLTADRWGLLANERVERALVRTALRLGEFATAKHYATRILERFPNDTGVRLELGQALEQTGRLEEAEEQYRAIIAQWDAAASTFSERGRSSRADLGGSANALRAPPALVSAHHALGELLARRGDFAAATDQMRTALLYDPGRSAARAALGSALAELGRFDEAITYLQHAVQNEPRLTDACYNLGTILAYLGRFDEAIEYYEKALAAGMEDAELHNNLGFAMLRTGQNGRAGDHFRRAIRIDPTNADAHFNLARLLESQQAMRSAQEHYRTAARLDQRYAHLLAPGPPK